MAITNLQIIALITTALPFTAAQIVYTEPTPIFPPQSKCVLFPTHFTTPDSDLFLQKYCGSAIDWPLSLTSYDLQNSNHSKAQTEYKIYYQKYLENPGSDEHLKYLTVDCLAIIRKILCAHYFPYCVEETGLSHAGICSKTCKLLSSRCPLETELYDQVCGGELRDIDCTASWGLTVWAVFGFVGVLAFGLFEG
jgi:hypothetical protein